MKYIFAFSLFVVGCFLKNEKSDPYDQYRNLPSYLSNYYLNEDTVSLNNAYQLLETNQDFNKKGLTDYNYRIVLPILFHLKKYDEILFLVENENFLEKHDKQIIINVTKYLNAPLEKKDSSIIYIQRNIQLTLEQIEKEPMDSLILIEYFSNILFIEGLDSTLEKIDSFKVQNPQFSNSYYENTLKDAVISYYNYFVE
ncbi:MAG: hypothetical protein WAT52_03905 [Chitinophagales bacterium]